MTRPSYALWRLKINKISSILAINKYYCRNTIFMITWVEINKKAINYNIKLFRTLIGPKVALMPVLKSNAYGHGLLLIAKICEKNKAVDCLCVFSLAEALELRHHRILKPILVLGFYETDEKKLIEAINFGIRFPLYTVEQARRLNRAGEKARKKALVHLKIDIGTSRIGVLPHELADFIKKIKQLKFLECEGIWGHFASSEDDPIRTNQQNQVFEKAIGLAARNGLKPKLIHAACSATTILYKKIHYTAVRMGLALYGLNPSPATKRKLQFEPVLSWYTKIIQLKSIPKDSKISYGGTFVTKRPSTIAIIPVGYWDGYDRGLSNNSSVIVRGKRCLVRGRVCMNLCVVDVTKVAGVKVGDTVSLIGKHGKITVTVDELARRAQTINYEIVARVNPLLPRIVV
ncbi:MAG: alanine racemase [Candidatus Magasanikbacteria bacterium]|nr:alanine racemase [Candidatus Magasanikbacteria bacterium]